MTAPALVATGIAKRFGGVRALSDATLTTERGEVHGLVGQNGSGKSTLIKILAGYETPDAGELEMYGQAVRLPLYPGQYRELGLAFVHQDLGLIPSLSVVENLCVEEFAAARRRWTIRWGKERARASQLFARYGIHVDPKATVAALSPLDQAYVAIIRAIDLFNRSSGEEGTGVLVLDEPTVRLPRSARAGLFTLIRRVAEAGGTVLFVSHYLDEVLAVTDRVTVLRNGCVVVSAAATSELSADKLAGAIVGSGRTDVVLGRRRARSSRRETAGDDIEFVDVRGTIVDDVSMRVGAGEIVGATGLPGAGFEELCYLMFGASRADGGELRMGEETIQLAALTPERAIERGVALVPADRQVDGSIGELSAIDNVTMHVLDRLAPWYRLERREMVGRTRGVMERFDVRPPRPSLIYAGFSGGNQQKLLLGKWLQTQPRLLLAHEPTQGVDVGARQDILDIISDVARGHGAAVLYVSVDHDEVAAVCDRVVVFADGRIREELEGEDVTAAAIGRACYADEAPKTVLYEQSDE